MFLIYWYWFDRPAGDLLTVINYHRKQVLESIIQVIANIGTT